MGDRFCERSNLRTGRKKGQQGGVLKKDKQHRSIRKGRSSLPNGKTRARIFLVEKQNGNRARRMRSNVRGKKKSARCFTGRGRRAIFET